MEFYPKSDQCHYFRPDSHVLDNYPLPCDEIEFYRGDKLLKITYGYKNYWLGISDVGTLAGFLTIPRKGVVADLVVLKVSTFDFRIFLRKWKNDEQVEAEMAKYMGDELDQGAYSCGYTDYAKNMEAFDRAKPKYQPSGAFVPSISQNPLDLISLYNTPTIYGNPPESLPSPANGVFNPNWLQGSGRMF